MTEGHTDDIADGPPRALLVAAMVVAVAAVVVVLGVAAVRQGSPEAQPVAIAGVPAPQAQSAECRALLDALPEQLGDYRRAATVDPTPAGAAAWQADPGGEPVILRCGLDRPADFTVASPLQVVAPVQWFRVGEAGAGDDRVGEAGAGDDSARSTWYVVDRPVYVALTLPAGSGPTPIQKISEAVAETMPATRPDPAPIS